MLGLEGMDSFAERSTHRRINELTNLTASQELGNSLSRGSYQQSALSFGQLENAHVCFAACSHRRTKLCSAKLLKRTEDCEKKTARKGEAARRRASNEIGIWNRLLKQKQQRQQTKIPVSDELRFGLQDIFHVHRGSNTLSWWVWRPFASSCSCTNLPLPCKVPVLLRRDDSTLLWSNKRRDEFDNIVQRRKNHSWSLSFYEKIQNSATASFESQWLGKR